MSRSIRWNLLIFASPEIDPPFLLNPPRQVRLQVQQAASRNCFGFIVTQVTLLSVSGHAIICVCDISS